MTDEAGPAAMAGTGPATCFIWLSQRVWSSEAWGQIDDLISTRDRLGIRRPSCCAEGTVETPREALPETSEPLRFSFPGLEMFLTSSKALSIRLRLDERVGRKRWRSVRESTLRLLAVDCRPGRSDTNSKGKDHDQYPLGSKG